MIDDFMIFCTRKQDVNYPTACIKLKGYEDNTHIFYGAQSVRISLKTYKFKFCFVHNPKQAFKYLQDAAEQCHVNAEMNLALMYESGHGIPKDLEKAFFWYKRCANTGDKDAQYRLGIMYYSGDGIVKDINEAIFWLNKSAEQGHQEAKKALQKLGK